MCIGISKGIFDAGNEVDTHLNLLSHGLMILRAWRIRFGLTLDKFEVDDDEVVVEVELVNEADDEV